VAVYGYIRVSTDRQADEGESLGTQQRQIEGYAMVIGVALDQVYVERGVSGSDRIRERVLDVKSDQRKRKRFLGGTVPFGWRVGEDGGLVEVPEQQATIREVLALRQEGLSLRAIADKIGGKISHVTVKNVLSNTAQTTKIA
jgi:DNA invertase Pin-like site-specific DNA recombinase